MKITTLQARELARRFRELAVELGNYRFAHWDRLLPAERAELESMEWSLLTYASDLITQAVGLVLERAHPSVNRLREVTGEARKAVEGLRDVKRAIRVASLAMQLAASLVTHQSDAVASALNRLAEEVGE